ncbi:MAG: DUF1501 domain-containing protein [Isosphaera sp.]|nr:DUF1501 domain-containing protein [Isosphaera sp.]
MLTISDPRPTRHCQGASRREFLRVGGLGLLGGLGLSDLLAARAKAAAEGRLWRDRSVVLLFLQGGPSHIEFFDPKMTAPEEVRSITGEVKTGIPGVTFGASFPQLAGMTDKLAVVRSYASMNGGHTYLSAAGGDNPVKAAMGAVYAKVAGTTSAATGVPNNCLVLPEAVDPGLKLQSNFETSALPTLTSPGELGPAYAAFDPSGGDQLKKNLQLNLPTERFEDRRALLAELDAAKRTADAGAAEVDKFRQQAFDVIARGVGEAFDLSREDPKTVARYDTSKLFKLGDVTKWFDQRRATNLLGRQMLLARRLCEAGAGFVTVSDCGWDMHANKNSPADMANLDPMARQVDHAVAAFIRDIHERGLSDKVLLVVTGEMGRTPKKNKTGGRDHYANLTSLLLAGGVKTGQVIGQSDRTASQPATDRYTPKNLLATVMNFLLDIPEVRLRPALGKVGTALTEGTPIPGLL